MDAHQKYSLLFTTHYTSDFAKAELQIQFAHDRKELLTNAWNIPITQSLEATKEPQASLARLTDYKSMLWALAQIGLPSSFDSDEMFHAYLADSDRGLLDRPAFIRKLGFLLNKGSDEDIQNFDFVAYENQAKSGLADFRNILDSKLAAARTAGGDAPLAIVGGLAGLEKVSEAYVACTPH